jgi:hypothetical protein
LFCRISRKGTLGPCDNYKWWQMPFQPKHLCGREGLLVSASRKLDSSCMLIQFLGRFSGKRCDTLNKTGCSQIYSTWRGERGEEWSSAQGLESILISIQSLMSPNPFENEPGFENANAEEDKQNQKLYIWKVRAR